MVNIATAGALLCLLLVLVSMGWNVYKQSQVRHSNYQPREIAVQANSRRNAYRVNDIVAANLFGDPSPRVVVKKAPKTTLNLTLQGILWASESSMARAIIQTGKKASELYSVGESIKGASASVKEIRAGEVLLDRNGATESLPLIKQTSSGNRQLVTYNDPAQAATSRPVARKLTQRSRNMTRPVTQKKRAPNGAPRKVRKPNFSGLDRALKKMGEL